ncbi:hypothetical protein T01_10925 [Trichinella spiralis]|uniref:Uncharacterized protein n=1 Tax=Trichinella spiralis TaxID=6334 RepID=A0A0V1BJW4_TRISP|nr:hypothetical protein T01_10925 [Trichinella spiralis]
MHVTSLQLSSIIRRGIADIPFIMRRYLPFSCLNCLQRLLIRSITILSNTFKKHQNKLLNGSTLHLVHQTHRPYYFYAFSTASNISLSLNVPNNGASLMVSNCLTLSRDNLKFLNFSVSAM